MIYNDISSKLLYQPNAFSNIYCGANIYETANVFTDHSSLRLFCAELMSFCKFTGGQEIQNLQHDNQMPKTGGKTTETQNLFPESLTIPSYPSLFILELAAL